MSLSERQRIGAAALINAGAFAVGIALAVTAVADYATGDPGAREAVAFLVDNQALLFSWYLIIYILFAVSLVVLVLALHERLKLGSPALANAATAFGLIWATLVFASGTIAIVGIAAVVDLHDRNPEDARTVWSALDAVTNGLSGIEFVSGMWVLLVSWAALRAAFLPRAINILGVIIGVSGLLTIVPPLDALSAVFGIGMIIWFVCLALHMLRGRADDRLSGVPCALRDGPPPH